MKKVATLKEDFQVKVLFSKVSMSIGNNTTEFRNK